MEEPSYSERTWGARRRLGAFISVLLVFSLLACGGGSDRDPPSATPPTSTPPIAPGVPTLDATPPPLPIPDTEPAANITLPAGFSAYAVATGFFRATSIAVADDGTIYVSERHGAVRRLADEDGDGVFESITTFAVTGGEITGLLAAPEGGLYVSRTGALLLVKDEDRDGIVDSSEEIVSNLPNGRHQNNGLVLGPDGRLYLTNGSTCDDCDEKDERSATILRVDPNGDNLEVYASGLRNPYDLVFDAQGRLWATDNGSDEPCETVDELDLIVDGGDYGWPYGEDGCAPLSDGIPPVASLGLHTAATGIDSYGADQFPPDYRGDLFVTLWGSFFAEPELLPQLLRVVIEETASGPRATVETFAEGFQHPIDALVDHDGTLLVLDYGTGGADDRDGTLYRIIYTG
ncbi:MAG: PQQ-dependent sugar dehydrogenase [Chloroflexi bacterium]|nr:PQQ-dependent sugar dehydrogenase [Chloroflexota bacterium]